MDVSDASITLREGLRNMGIVSTVRKGVPKSIAFRLATYLPQGLHLVPDIKRFLPGYEVRQIFDVGANEGQTAFGYREAFSNARIDCFEPAPATYERLRQRFSGSGLVHCHNVALGSSIGILRMSTDESRSELSRISAEGDIEVHVTTADAFAADKGVERINLLKIDAEGHDLEVLRGASELLDAQRVDLLQIECGMNPDNSDHIYIENISELLHSHTYRVFGIYEQRHEWPTGSPYLRRSNVVYISRRMIDTWRSR